MDGAAIFTLGYQLRSRDSFISELLAAGVSVLVDVRETAWSNRREYGASSLRAALAEAGISYVHAVFAGNPKVLRRTAASHDDCLRAYGEYLDATPVVVERLDELLVSLLSDGAKVCLMCYERHPEDCHRTVLLNRWRGVTEGEVAIRHLATEGAPRLGGDRKG